MGDYIQQLLGNAMGNALGSAGLQGLGSPNIGLAQQLGMQQSPYPYLSQQQAMLQNLQAATFNQSLPPFFNHYEIGSDLWERKEWDRRFAESMGWDDMKFYAILKEIKE